MNSHDDTSPPFTVPVADLVVEGFAGPGGWSEGLRLAGYDGAAVGLEHDMAACRTAVAAGHARICADVATYPTVPFEGRMDGLIQSPPCTTFSGAGNGAGRLLTEILLTAMTRISRGGKAVAWARRECTKVLKQHARTAPKLSKRSRAYRSAWACDQAAMSVLVLQPIRWVVACRPRWVALEQVPQVAPLWRHLAMLLREHGYRAWSGVLSAEEYGVPQTRKRAILMARRDGLPVGPPEPTHQPYRSGVAYETESSLFGDPLPRPVSMADALGWGLPGQPSSVVMTARGRQAGPEDASRGSSWRHDWFQRQIADGNWVMRSNYGNNGDAQDRGERDSTEPAPTVTGKVNRNKVVLRGGQSVGGDPTTRGERTEDEPAQTVMSTVNRSMWTFRNGATDRNMCPGNNSRVAKDKVLPYHRDVAAPSTGLTSNVGSWRVHGPAGKECREARTDEQSVRVTVQEAGVLQSFPADYPWQGTKSAQYRQVGDAIPPLLAVAILRPLLMRSGS